MRLEKLKHSCKDEDSDRFSELSEHIIHRILSLVPIKDAGRTCLLSKTWRSLCSSYNIVPSLHYDHNSFALELLLNAESEPKIDEIRDKFMEYAVKGLINVIKQHSPVLKLAVDVAVINSEFARVDLFMDLVRKAKIEELSIFVQTRDFRWHGDLSQGVVFYDFPYSLIPASKWLRCLTVQGCKFTHQLSTNNVIGSNNNVDMFSSLRQLFLSQVLFLSEEALSNLAYCCPRIELIEFDYCSFSITTLKLSKFPKLKKASVKGDRQYGLQYVDITETNLESFQCTKVRCLMSVAACSNMKELALTSCSVNKSDLLKEFTTYFPLLETANLSSVMSFEGTFDRMTAANPCIRTLRLSLNRVIQVIKLDCPKLRSFKCSSAGFEEMHMNCPKLKMYYYYSSKVPRLISLDLPTNMKHFLLGFQVSYELDTSWFIRLRKFLEQTRRCNNVYCYLLISPNTTSKLVLDKFRAFQTCKYHNVHLQVEIEHGDEGVRISSAALVDSLLWTIQPDFLYVGGTSYDFVKNLCGKLSENRDKSCCDQQLCNKYWWHNISDFYVDYMDEDMKLNLASLVEKCKQNQQTTISFRISSHYRLPTRFEFEWQ